MDREAWRAEVHGVAKSWTRLSELNWIICQRDGKENRHQGEIKINLMEGKKKIGSFLEHIAKIPT